MQDDVCSAKELASLIGVTERTVRKLAGENRVVRRSTGRYAVRESVAKYCEHLRHMAAQHGDEETALDLTRERARYASEQADAVAIKNAVSRNELLPARDVEARWSAVLRDVKARMLALPARLEQRLGHLSKHDVTAIDREVRDALEEAGNA